MEETQPHYGGVGGVTSVATRRGPTPPVGLGAGAGAGWAGSLGSAGGCWVVLTLWMGLGGTFGGVEGGWLDGRGREGDFFGTLGDFGRNFLDIRWVLWHWGAGLQRTGDGMGTWWSLWRHLESSPWLTGLGRPLARGEALGSTGRGSGSAAGCACPLVGLQGAWRSFWNLAVIFWLLRWRSWQEQ